MPTVKFSHVDKIYNNKVQAVFDFNLDVKDKEFIVLVGPSGCGKSTTLRMLAGLEEISGGEISIDDEVVNDVLPKNRNIAMVFQNYALYPHMSVYDNMAFALKIRHFDSDTIDARVKEAAEILALTPYLKRKPKELSGGQRQRVALGRAIVREPKVFLMDEPLSNLDAKLRVQMRSEIAKIHQKVGATTIYVTHDQTEAMTMADRIVIMKDGWIQQIGSPKEVYNFPENIFVGGFMGSPATNFIEGFFKNGNFIIPPVKEDQKEIQIKLNEEHTNLLKNYAKVKIEELNDVIRDETNWLEENAQEPAGLDKKNLAIYKDNLEKKKNSLQSHKDMLVEFENENFHLIMGVRPEEVIIEERGILKANCELTELLGKDSIIYTYLNSQRLIIQTSADNEVPQNNDFNINFNFKKVHFFDVESTKRIR